MGALRLGCLPPLPPGDLIERAEAAAAAADVAVVVVGLNSDWETEGRDRDTLALAGAQDELVARVVAANPNTVVVVNAGAPVLMPWAEQVPGIVQLWYPGQEGGRALADVLFGDVNPSGRLPTTFPRRIEDTPTFLHEADEGERIVYGEGVYVGYRWYDTRDIEPTFCFGHGLSYTTFDYGPADVTEPDADGRRTITVTVTNTGDRAGKEIVQLYVAPPPGIRRPAQELRAFAAVTLEPGRSEPVPLVLDDRAFAYWDAVDHAWATPSGTYELRLGPSSRDLRTTVPLEIKDRPDPVGTASAE
jgi:beta-glucosidase